MLLLLRIAPILPKVIKYLNLLPAISIIIATTAIIKTDALRCDWTKNNISITGAKYKTSGLKKPSHLSSIFSLLSVKYEAKNITNAIFATSEGWKLNVPN